MSDKLKALAGIGIAMILSGVVIAQGVVTQRNLSLAMAKTIAEAALAECKAKGFNTSAAVVDRAGQVLVIMRDEQATAQTADMARRKAYTARMFRITTMEFQKRTAEDPARAAQRDLADILALSGGVPVQVGNDTIGAVGSAGSTLQQDDACSKAGVAKVADLLK
jgi:uncharacterized protein GlcG (DUF336 family)